MCCTAYAPTYVALRMGSVPPHPGAITPVCVCPSMRKPQNTARRDRFPARSRRDPADRVCPGIRRAPDGRHPAPSGNCNTNLRMPPHTAHDRHKAFHPRLGPKCRLTYASTYANRRTRHGTTAFRRNPANRVCPGIQDATETGTAIQTATGHARPPPKKTQRGGSPHVQGFRLFGRPASTGLSLPIQAFTPIPAGTGAYLRAPVCQIRSR